MKSSKIILGTVQFGLDYGVNNFNGKPNDQVVNDILDLAFENNISMLDTAEIYGNSQERIGHYIKESGNQFEIVTKFTPNRTDLPSNIVKRVLNNISILNVSYLYAYMFHSFSDFKTFYPQFEKDLIKLKEEGKIKKIGVSLHSNEEIEEVLNFPNINLIQLPFNLLDNQNQRGECLLKAKQNNVEVHTRSIFLQGLFFKETLSDYFISFKDDLRKLKSKCNLNYKMNDMAINYAYSQSYIDKVLIGVDNTSQLKNNIESLDKGISSELIDFICNINVVDKEKLNPVNWSL